MRQRPHVLHDVTLGTQDRVDPVTGVVDPELHRHRPLQYRADALPQPPGGVRLRVPDGSEDLQHVGARDLRDRHLPNAREGVPLEGQDPVAAVRPTSPAGLLLFYHTRGGFGEARYALPTTLLGKRVAVRVSSRRGRAHEGGRQGLVWMTALGLGFPGGVALFVTVTIPT